MRSHLDILKEIAAFEPVSGVWLPLDSLLIGVSDFLCAGRLRGTTTVPT